MCSGSIGSEFAINLGLVWGKFGMGSGCVWGEFVGAFRDKMERGVKEKQQQVLGTSGTSRLLENHSRFYLVNLTVRMSRVSWNQSKSCYSEESKVHNSMCSYVRVLMQSV